jgi:hypothetical protein
VRKIPRNRRSLTGYFASQKMRRMVAFESALERDTFALLEFDPTVEEYVEQPLHVYYADGSTNRVHIPDILAKYRQDIGLEYGHCLYQVKYSEELLLRWPEFHPQLRAASRFAHNRGWKFRIATERTIRTTFLKNVKLLLPYRSRPFDISDANILLKLAQSDDEDCTIGDLLSRAEESFERKDAAGLIWHLIARHRLRVDLEEPLTLKTLVKRP